MQNLNLDMRRLKIILFLILFSFTFNSVSASNSNKVLIISSYGTDYGWSNSIIDGISAAIKEKFPSLELNVEYMSSEKFSKTDTWVNRINILLENFNENPPIAIVLISDEAWMAYRSANIANFKNTPVLLCAVKPHSISVEDYTNKYNNLQLSDFSSTYSLLNNFNASGVIRSMNTDGYVDLMHQFNPSTDGFLLVTDNRFYGIYTKLIFKQLVAEKYSSHTFESLDARFVNTDSLLARLPEISKSKSVLLTSWLTGEHGFEFSKNYIYKRMSDVLETPIFITNDIGIESNYFIGGYFNDGVFWGKETGEMLLRIIDGEDINLILPITYKDTECNVNWKVFNQYKKSDSSLPKDVIYINEPESIFTKFRNTIVSIIIIFIILLSTFTYILVNHIKLRKAQRLTLELMNNAEKSNHELDTARTNLMKALEKVEESDRMKSAFIANMSHEIRTPLNAIVGFATIYSQLESDEERRDAENIIKDNSDQLLHLISDILIISELESGDITLSYDDIDPSAIYSDVVSILQSKCAPNVELFFDEPEQSIIIHSDYSKLMQVIMILTSNAIKFTKDGSVHIGYYTTEDKKVCFYVQDTGIGINPENYKSIFERFVKIDDYIEGTGLGLPIAKAIATLLGGEIRVQSKLGAGTTFELIIQG